MTQPHDQTKPDHKRRRRIGCGVALLAVIVGLGLAVWIAMRLWAAEPWYWQDRRQVRAATPQVQMRQTAERFEKRMVTEVTADVDGPRTITIPLDEANAWLDQLLGDWLANQDRELPAEVSGLMLAAAGDNIIIAFRVRSDDLDQVFSMFFDVRVQKDGRAHVALDAIRGGRLPVPAGMVLELLHDAAPREATDILLGKNPIDPALKIDGARQLRLLDLNVHDDRIELRVQTEPQKR